MKTKLLMTTFALVASSDVFAQGFTGNNGQTQAGFSGPTQGISTVKQVLDAGMFSDDMPVPHLVVKCTCLATQQVK